MHSGCFQAMGAGLTCERDGVYPVLGPAPEASSSQSSTAAAKNCNNCCPAAGTPEDISQPQGLLYGTAGVEAESDDEEPNAKWEEGLGIETVRRGSVGFVFDAKLTCSMDDIDSAPVGLPVGVLTVSVICAKNIVSPKKTKDSRRADTFVSVKVGSTVHKTCCRQESVNPVWGLAHCFSFVVQSMAESVYVDIYSELDHADDSGNVLNHLGYVHQEFAEADGLRRRPTVAGLLAKTDGIWAVDTSVQSRRKKAVEEPPPEKAAKPAKWKAAAAETPVMVKMITMSAEVILRYSFSFVSSTVSVMPTLMPKLIVCQSCHHGIESILHTVVGHSKMKCTLCKNNVQKPFEDWFSHMISQGGQVCNSCNDFGLCLKCIRCHRPPCGILRIRVLSAQIPTILGETGAIVGIQFENDTLWTDASKLPVKPVAKKGSADEDLWRTTCWDEYLYFLVREPLLLNLMGKVTYLAHGDGEETSLSAETLESVVTFRATADHQALHAPKTLQPHVEVSEDLCFQKEHVLVEIRNDRLPGKLVSVKLEVSVLALQSDAPKGGRSNQRNSDVSQGSAHSLPRPSNASTSASSGPSGGSPTAA